MNPESIPSPVVLKNKGVPIDVYQVEPVVEDGRTRWEAVFMGDEPVVEKRWVRFTANVLAAIEDEFGDLGGYKDAISGRPALDADGKVVTENGAVVWEVKPRQNGVVRWTLGQIWGWDEERVGAAMVIGDLGYSSAIGAALSIANGMDPTHAVEILRMGIRAAKDRSEAANEEAARLLAEVREAAGTDASATPGEPGGDSGSPSDAGTTSSGSEAPSRSSTSSGSGPTFTAPHDPARELLATSSVPSA